MMIKQIIIIFYFFVLLNADPLFEILNSTDEPFYNHKINKVYSSSYVAVAPKIDGVLSESCWLVIDNASDDSVISDFIQDDPENLSEPSHSSHVMISYDKNNIYIAAKLYDSEPEKIEGRFSKRDQFDPELSDWFSIEFDTDHDHQSGYFFAVNSAGIQADAIIHSESELDFEYNSVWDAIALVDEDGWKVEIKIPFKMMSITQLKNPWGVNISRFICRYNETDRWVALGKDFIGRSSHFGHLVGLTEMEIKRSVDFRPYALGGLNNYNNLYLVDDQLYPDSLTENKYKTIENPIGIDIKFRLSPSNSLDLSINPDFGQIEMDPRIINLSAYEIYLPEKRTFFNEISSLFNTPIDIFYSRRIGGPVAGKNNKITSATRFFGKTNKGYEYGFILANTIPENDNFSTTNNSYYFAGRTTKEIFNNTSVLGISATNFIFNNNRSTVISLDGISYLLSNNLLIDYQFIKSTKDDTNGNGFILDFEYNQLYPLSVKMSLDVFDKTFEINDMGYLFRNNIKAHDIELSVVRERQLLNLIRKTKVIINHQRSNNFDDFLLKDSYGMHFFAESINYDRIVVGYNHNKEHYDDLYMYDYEQNIFNQDPFLIEQSSHSFLYFSTDLRNRISYNLDFQLRESVNQDRHIQSNIEATYNLGDGFMSSLSYSRINSENKYHFLEIVEDDNDSDIDHYVFSNFQASQNRYGLQVEKYFNKKISLQIYSEYLSHSNQFGDYREWEDNEIRYTEFITGNSDTNVLPLYTTGEEGLSFEVIDGEIITEQYLDPNYYIGFYSRYTSLDFNLSFKWEYASGSELYVIYKLSHAVNGQSFNNIIDFINYSGKNTWTENYFDNAFYIKLNYWFNI